MYPACAISKKYILGAPEVIIGNQTKEFVWGEKNLFLPNKDGTLEEVEGLLLVRVTLPRAASKSFQGIPFLPQKIQQKSIGGHSKTTWTLV